MASDEATVQPLTTPATVASPPAADIGGAGVQVAQSRSLRTLAASGAAWGTFNSAYRQLVRVVVAIVLARLLTPADYGLAAMAFVLTSFVLTFSDASLGKALIQRPTIDELDRSTVFWTTFAIGVVLTCVGVAASGMIAAFFHQPALKPLVAVLSVSFVLISLQMTPAALLQREMRFRATVIRFTVGTTVAGIAGIAVAAAGGGAWALILQQLAFAGTSTLLLWTLSGWRPRLAFSWARLRSLGSFGIRVMFARLMDDISGNADNMLVGRYLGSAALGAYSVAYNVMLVPISKLALPIQESLFPVLSRVQDDRERVARMWLRSTVLLAVLLAPLMVGLAIVAPEFVRVVLGSRWAAVVPVVRILAPTAILQSLGGLASTVLLAIDRPKTVFRFSFANTVLTLIAFVVGLHWGIVGVATGYAAVVSPLSIYLIVRVAKIVSARPVDVAGRLGQVVQVTAVMAAGVALVQWYARSVELAPSMMLVLLVAAGALLYVPLCLLLVEHAREESRRVWGFLLVRLRRPSSDPALAKAS